jgi:hypothetical protein
VDNTVTTSKLKIAKDKKIGLETGRNRAASGSARLEDILNYPGLRQKPAKTHDTGARLRCLSTVGGTHDSSESANECRTGHLAGYKLVFFTTLDRTEVDVIVQVNIFHLNSQTSAIRADVTNARFKGKNCHAVSIPVAA